MPVFVAPYFAAAGVWTNLEIGTLSALAVGVAAIGVLVGRARRSARQYALDLAETERALQETRARAALATQESQAKTEMLATLSREVRSHLNGIIGSADLLLDEPLASGPRQHISTLRTSAESLHRSLNDVLDYSSIETGRLRIDAKPFELAEPFINVVEELTPLARLKNLDLVLVVAPESPRRVVGDAGRIRQIVLNLGANAVKFTANGRIVVRVGPTPDSSGTGNPGRPWVHISVSDTGPRIPEEMQSTLFDRLAGAATDSPRRFGGSGLDLVLSKRLVELMGGSIGARNLAESGFEFWVMLPLAPAPENAPPARAIAPELHTIVLDGDAASRLATSAILARLEVDHDVTDVLPKALDLLRQASRDGAREQVLLVDELAVAQRTGELLRELQQDPALRGTRIALLARDPTTATATAMALGAISVLAKPLLRLEPMIEALDRQRGGAEDSAAALEPLVLVVDDDEISRSVASQLLQKQGCRVELAFSGRAAIERVQAIAFDLIFMDCQMPEVDGYETTRRIRATLGNSAPPIVALTANTTPADRERAFSAGMVDFVDKPVRRAELTRVLERWIPVKR